MIPDDLDTKPPAKDYTSDCTDNEEEATDEIDVRRNKNQAVAQCDIEINGCEIKNNDRNEIPLDAKVSLAMQISVATIPGACHSSATSDDSSRSKPCLIAQWGELARLRAVQKEGQSGQQPGRGLEGCSSEEVRPIDELQGRMNDFHEGVLVENANDAERRKTMLKRRATKCLLLVLIVVGVAIGVSLGMQGASNGYASASSINSSRCILADTNDEMMTERFLTYHNAIRGKFPKISTLVDRPGSIQRSALCWVANLDAFDVAGDEIVQRFILVLIYRRFEPSPADDVAQVLELANQNWLTDVHECSWKHITCTPDNEVNILRLSGLSLSGKIPTEIALLTKLVHLDFSTNDLTGRMPTELWSMSQLEDLRVSANRLTGTISNNIANLSELKRVDIGRNWLTGTIPDLGTLSNLSSLSIYNNFKIGGTFPDLSKSTNLGTLELTNIGLSGTIPDYLWSHTSLTFLGLETTSLSGTIPTDVGNFQKLEIFLIARCRFSGTIPTELGRLSRLAYLSLEDNSFSGTLPKEICALTSSSLAELTIPHSIPCDCCTLNRL